MSPAFDQSQRSRRVLVTGGAGFIGSHLAELLWQGGDAVTVLDDLSTGALANLESLAGQPRFSFVRGDAADPSVVGPLVERADAVFHLAGVVGVQLVAGDPLRAMTGNLRGTEVVLALAARHRVPVLLSSSSEVYGQARVPFREADPVQPGRSQDPRGGYACAKAMGEWLAHAHARQHGLPVVIARLFNTVGPRQTGRYGMVLPRFVAQALAGGPITVYGDGSQRRCFASVHEVARALAGLMRDPRGCEVVNVGSATEVTILELAREVQQQAGTGAPIETVPFDRVFPPGFTDPGRRVPALERLHRALGWVPSTPLSVIVAEVLASHLLTVPAGQR